MSANSNFTCRKRKCKVSLAELNDSIDSEDGLCKQDNLKQSLRILNEELESFGISSITIDNIQSIESLKKTFVQVINSAWKLIHKHRYLMRIHEQMIELYQKNVSDNINLKSQMRRLKEELQKKELAICKAEEKERRLNVKYEDASRSLNQKNEEIRKLKRQAQYKEIQHKHEVRRILQNNLKLQEQLQKSAGCFTSRDKVLQKMREKELATYKQTICRLEENNTHMLDEINNLKGALELHQTGIDLYIEASGAWTNVTS